MLRNDWIYKRGDIYLADLGTPSGSVQGGTRPVINIQNNTGSFFGPTLIVIPLTTELKKLNQPTHYVLKHQYGLDEVSMSEAEQPVTINKSQVIKYLGKTSRRHMERIDDCLRVSLHSGGVEDKCGETIYEITALRGFMDSLVGSDAGLLHRFDTDPDRRS